MITFRPTSGGRKVRCSVCGRDGYGPTHPQTVFDCYPWQRKCFQNPDHPYVCSCGKRWPSKGSIAAHIRTMLRVHNEIHERKEPA